MSKYKEILELKAYCDSIGVEVQLQSFIDGYALLFKNGGDVVQHCASLRSNKGCLEFGFTTYPSFDFTPQSLQKAKEFVLKRKDVLNNRRKRKCSKR